MSGTSVSKRLGWLGTSRRDRTLCRQRGRSLAEMFLLPGGHTLYIRELPAPSECSGFIHTKESAIAGAIVKLPGWGSSEKSPIIAK